jgi:hypothetical protein
MPTVSLTRLEELRDIRYHRTPRLRVTSEQEALAYVDDVGFSFVLSDQRIEMPTLWGAVTGSRRPVPPTHDDPDLGRVWRWKDTLPTEGSVFYGKALRSKPTLVSLRLLPHLYAVSPNYGELDDYVTQYEEGKLGAEAKNVYEALLEGGAMATSRLRREAGLPGAGKNARLFDRALTELQMELKIAKVGISDANRWGYAYVYDLFLRQFPDVPAAAREISTDQAMDSLLLQYLQNVVIVPIRDARLLFGWPDWEWERLTERLSTRNAIRTDLSLEGKAGPCLAIAEAPLSSLVA